MVLTGATTWASIRACRSSVASAAVSSAAGRLGWFGEEALSPEDEGDTAALSWSNVLVDWLMAGAVWVTMPDTCMGRGVSISSKASMR
ncbi:hypothetical protein D3C85_1657640 [compost metagenome]